MRPPWLRDRLRVRVVMSRRRWRRLQPREKDRRDIGTAQGDIDYLKAVSEIDAGLGRKDEAIREAQRAVDLAPIAKDLSNAPTQLSTWRWFTRGPASATARSSNSKLSRRSRPATYGDLLLNPCWDSLRGDKRFHKIVAAAKAASR